MRRKSSNFVKIKYAPSKKEAELTAKKYLKGIGEKIGLKLAIMFGSYAKNTYSYGSDIDMLLVAEKLPEKPKDRPQILLDPNLEVYIEPFAYTEEEFDKMVRENHPIAKEALKNGKIIYITPDYKKKLTRIKQALKTFN